MSLQDLQDEIARLQKDLEDLIATFNFNLANTPDHHNEAALREHEDEIDEYRQNIKEVEQLIKQKQDL